MALHQFDYLFAIAMIFAFLDAWNVVPMMLQIPSLHQFHPDL